MTCDLNLHVLHIIRFTIMIVVNVLWVHFCQSVEDLVIGHMTKEYLYMLVTSGFILKTKGATVHFCMEIACLKFAYSMKKSPVCVTGAYRHKNELCFT